MNQCQVMGYGGSVDAPENLSWMGIVKHAQKQKSIPALFWILLVSHNFNSVIPGKLQSESFSHIFLLDHESTAVKSKCYLVPTETWQMLIDVSGYKNDAMSIIHNYKAFHFRHHCRYDSPCNCQCCWSKTNHFCVMLSEAHHNYLAKSLLW